MTEQPTCGKCGGVMTRENAKIHPEYFLHDACLPEELQVVHAFGEASERAMAVAKQILPKRLTKADIENAAASLFITENGVVCDWLLTCKDDDYSGEHGHYRSLADVVNLLCRHLEITE